MFENILKSLVLSSIIVQIVGRMPVDLLACQTRLAVWPRPGILTKPVPSPRVDGIGASSAHAGSRMIRYVRLRARPADPGAILAATLAVVVIQTLRRRFLKGAPVVATAVLDVREDAGLVVAEAAVGGAADEALACVARGGQGLVGGGLVLGDGGVLLGRQLMG